MLASILNTIMPGRRTGNNHRKKAVDPKFASKYSPVLLPRRLSQDSCPLQNNGGIRYPTTQMTSSSEVPSKKRFIFNRRSRSTREPHQYSWVNGARISKFPEKTQTEILKSFMATVDDEVSVPQGSLVTALYKDTTGQWIYVKRGDGQHGYVPDLICSLLVPVEVGHDEGPDAEKPKISRRKSQQIKRELKKFHKREFEKRAEQLFHNTSDGSNATSKLPNRYGSSVGYSAKFLKTASMDRLHLKSKKAPPTGQTQTMGPKTPMGGSISNVTAQAIASVAADRNRKAYLQQSGLITLDRAKPRRLPTMAERQFAMNENLRRFLSSLPEFPPPPPEQEKLMADDDGIHDTTYEEDDDEQGSDRKPVAEGKNILFEAKAESQPNLNDLDDNSGVFRVDVGHEKQRKIRSAKNHPQLSASTPDFETEFGLIQTRPRPPPKPLNSATLSRLHSEVMSKKQSSTMQRRQQMAPKNGTASLARPSNNWRPSEPVVHELVAIQDFRAETQIDLGIKRGDRLSTVFSAVNGWIWATHLRTKNQGFVPSSAVILSSEFS